MADIVGVGTGNTIVYSILSQLFTVTDADSTGFIVKNNFGTVVVAGSGFSITDQGNGQYAVTGTITDVAYDSTDPHVPGTSIQSWTGLNVSFADLLNIFTVTHDQNAFNNLFFGGNDTFTYASLPGSVGLSGTNTYLYGYGGNDVFNFTGWISNSFQDIGVDGGSGNDTLNIAGGVAGTVKAGGYGNYSNFNVANVETVNLGAGYDYTIIAPDYLVAAGKTLTIDGSALGPSNHFVFNTSLTSGTTFSGNIVLIGGAGDDTFQGGSGSSTFIGGGGSDTVSFANGRNTAGVVASLAITSAQSVGGPYGGTATFLGIENLVGTWNADTLTGDANDNILNGMGGGDILNGGAGFDTAVFGVARSNYTITHSGATTTISSAFDGTTTLTGVEQAQFSDQTVQISGPVITTNDIRIAAGQNVALSSLFSVNDLNGAAITGYQIWDGSNDPNSGYFTINGVQQTARTILNVSAAQISQIAYVSGTVNDGLQIRAFDGTSWSASDGGVWAPFTAGPTVNHAPVVTTGPTAFQPHRQTLALSTLFSVSDGDGDAITKYQLRDDTSDPNSGYFTINGVQQAAGTIIDVTTAQLAQTSFVTGLISDNLEIRAYDGFAWSAADNAAWSPFTVNLAEAYPHVTTADLSRAVGQTLTLSSLFSVVDNDGDPITRYQLWDGNSDPNSGHFVVGGVVQAAGTVIDVTAAQLASTTFVTGRLNDSLQIRASDGVGWSSADNVPWSPFTITVPANHAPILATVNRNLAAGSTVALSSLFSVSDADGDAMTRYQLRDSTANPTSGHFVVNGAVQPAGTVIDISAAQLAQTSFVIGSSVSDRLQIRAFDGLAWSADDNAPWAPFTISPPVARYDAQARDFDGGGSGDLLWQNDNGQASIWLMNGASLAGASWIGANPGPTWHVKASGDFNGDGTSDVLWQNDGGQASVWLMNGTTMTQAAWVGPNPGPTWHALATGDFDGDGKSDILWQNDSGQAAIWLMNGTSLSQAAWAGPNTGLAWHALATGDFDGDGKSDILWQNDSGQAAIWLMNGTTPAQTAWIGPNPGPTWHVEGAGDFDGDGKSDILWQNDSGQAAIWLMNGTTLTQASWIGPNPGPTWHVEAARDFNGDGNSDVLWRNDNGQASVWLMSGTTVTQAAWIGANPGNSWHIATG